MEEPKRQRTPYRIFLTYALINLYLWRLSGDMKIAATIFGILIGIFLIVSGTLLPLDIIISILLVCMGAIVITASITYLDYIISYRR